MKKLSDNDRIFLKKRKRLVAMWNTVAVVMLIGLVALFLWIFFTSPYFANPLYVAEALKQNDIEASVMTVSTIMLPVVVIMQFATVAVFIVFGFAIFANEKRYLSMIENLSD